MTTRIVNLRKEKCDVYIGREGHGEDGYFGNPFVLDNTTTREEVIEQYRRYFENRIASDPEFRRRVCDLKDKVLGCFCKPKACHGDVIAEFLDNGYSSSSGGGSSI